MTSVSRVSQHRRVRRLALSFKKEVPVDALEEIVFHHLLGVAESLGGVLLEQTLDQVSYGRRMNIVKLNFTIFDVVKHLLAVGRVERWLPSQHFVDHATETPPVAGEAVVTFLFQHFRRKVLRSSAEGLCSFTFAHVLLRQTKISQHSVPFRIN